MACAGIARTAPIRCT